MKNYRRWIVGIAVCGAITALCFWLFKSKKPTPSIHVWQSLMTFTEMYVDGYAEDVGRSPATFQEMTNEIGPFGGGFKKSVDTVATMLHRDELRVVWRADLSVMESDTAKPARRRYVLAYQTTVTESAGYVCIVSGRPRISVEFMGPEEFSRLRMIPQRPAVTVHGPVNKH